MYKLPIWQFTDSSVRISSEAMLSPLGSDSRALHSESRARNGLTDSVAALIPQQFSVAFSQEMQLRALVVERFAMRSSISLEKRRDGRSRTRVELHIAIDVPDATVNQLIDALLEVKSRCEALAGSDIKIVMKAELQASHVVQKIGERAVDLAKLDLD